MYRKEAYSSLPNGSSWIVQNNLTYNRFDLTIWSLTGYESFRGTIEDFDSLSVAIQECCDDHRNDGGIRQHKPPRVTFQDIRAAELADFHKSFVRND